MGSSLSFCGLRASPSGSAASRSPLAPRDGRDLRRSGSQRLRAGSSAAASDASSVASILSNSDRLIPEAFAPVDIQVLSQRQRQRRPSRAGSSQASLAALYSSRGGSAAGDGAPLSQYASYGVKASRARLATASDASEDAELLLGSVGSGHGALPSRGLVRGCA